MIVEVGSVKLLYLVMVENKEKLDRSLNDLRVFIFSMHGPLHIELANLAFFTLKSIWGLH
jgi:hypothetical protein